MTAATARLSERTAPVPRPERTGIVHLGLGAFHRAHQAVYTEDAMRTAGDPGWGICGVTQRSDAVLRRLAPQDLLYTVLERGPGARPPRVVGAVREILAGHRDPAGVVAAIARPDVRIVTLTVTEKGYRHDPATGDLDLADQEIAADLAGRPPRTVIGQLVAGLAARTAPLTVVCCDNLSGNGPFLEGLVRQFAAAAGRAEVADRIGSAIRFPSTMVDRIVPATTEADRADVRASTGLDDEAVVVAEPFSQWVVEDDFAAGRPAWEQAGVQFTNDVEPWERLKLRVLNASHSLLAYLGLLAGHALIADAVADPLLSAACRALIQDDVRPVLTPPSGVDVTGYGESVLARFANPALRHTTIQVASDGSQKLGPRLLSTALDGLAAGRPARWVPIVVAAWLRHATDPRDAAGQPAELADPLAGLLRAAGPDPLALLDVRSVFPAELDRDRRFRSDVRTAFAGLAARGPRAVLTEMLDDPR
ncbi:MAG TPA: mannitol dehydrogenase family protein [Trebonia sp.]|jgi:fructuronate reductase